MEGAGATDSLSELASLFEELSDNKVSKDEVYKSEVLKRISDQIVTEKEMLKSSKTALLWLQYNYGSDFYFAAVH